MDATVKEQFPTPACSLIIFVATSTEEKAIKNQSDAFGIEVRSETYITKYFNGFGLKNKVWRLAVKGKDTIGQESVLLVGCSRISGNLVIGPHGRLGSAAKGVRYLEAAGAQGIIQVGIAFGVSRSQQKIGDVLVSRSLITYDIRDVKPVDNKLGYIYDYSKLSPEPARSALVARCEREKDRSKFEFNIHLGAMLSGSARIHCAKYRDELLNAVPHGNDPIVGGEMEGVGLLSAAKTEDPVWCVVKGISDFADEERDKEVYGGRELAAKNSALFVLSSLAKDAEAFN